ncbi:MAG: GTPase KRas precursor [Candidatus Heimdallarchaeota archaeon LC_3]|nr:MAG: GTPase KRas precursor [Candidatus Heimdallarchaeota archaeon LC_3]
MNSGASYLIKILVAGESAVGKTTLIQRYLSNRFLVGTKSTIGIDFFTKKIFGSENAIPKILKEDETLVLQIWDASGEEKFREVLPLYSAGTQGVLLCFDTTRPETLKKLIEWDEVLSSLITDPIPKILIQTKSDLNSKVDTEEIDDFIKKRKIRNNNYFLTSSKDGTNVKEVFSDIVKAIFTQLIDV